MSDPVKEAADLLKFTELRMKAHELMQEAAKLSHLPAVYQRQAQAAAYFCGDRLHRVIGERTAADAIAMRDDLEFMARRAIDPLVEAIGQEAHANFGVSVEASRNFMSRALDAGAGDNESPTAALTAAAHDLDESRDDTIAENRREFLTAE